MGERTSYEQALRAEMAAMRKVVAALDSVDQTARMRILAWVGDRYVTAPHDAPTVSDDTPASGQADTP